MTEYELRIIPDCPNSDAAIHLFRQSLEAEGVPAAQLGVRVVRTEDEATKLGFHGSPSFVVDGQDLFPSETAPAITCRVYRSAQGLAGLPAPESLRTAVRNARTSLR
ncbi:hypothetical protein [Arthrobacter sp. ISL-30]|uniref:hypothetical protein n=1 Tax=Arthrobacter sp. ISL-30 TaxID=2819109 RepID=UPI001BEB6782|nr:hypothetical protein [Arthrobacter sp. ISL-30]MBT2514581.1 hypothetical protein [Arthrobacter sp. ISL-30]